MVPAVNPMARDVIDLAILCSPHSQMEWKAESRILCRLSSMLPDERSFGWDYARMDQVVNSEEKVAECLLYSKSRFVRLLSELGNHGGKSC